MTEGELTAWLMRPGVLFAVMLLGSLGSMLNQISKAQREGRAVTCWQYLAHWPETMAMLIGNTFAFGTLLLAGQLNFAAAVGIGWVANSVADQIRAGGRSTSNAKETEEEGDTA